MNPCKTCNDLGVIIGRNNERPTFEICYSCKTYRENLKTPWGQVKIYAAGSKAFMEQENDIQHQLDNPYDHDDT